MDPYRSIDRTVASLGAPIRTYRRKPIMGLGPVVLTALFAAFVWYGASSHEKLEGAAWLMTVLAIAAAIVYAFELYRTRIASAVVVHEKGVVLVGLSPRVLPWEEITAVRFERKTRNRPGSMMFVPLPGVTLVSYSNQSEYYWLCRLEVGKRVVAEVSEGYSESAELVDTLRTRIAEREVPRVLEALSSGQSVELGVVTLAPSHLEVGGRDVPWSEIDAVTTEDADLVVVDRAGETRLRVRMDRVPNPQVVMDVAATLRSGA